MRLIDANALMRLLPSEEMVSKYTVANAPTVEAIPISIMIEELARARKMYDNSTELTEPFWRGNVTALEALIIGWEKENETN